MRRLAALALGLSVAACGGDRRVADRPVPPPPLAPVDAGAPTADGGTKVTTAAPSTGGVPHLATIVAAALSRHADAALTIDAVGEVRLWTALDGSAPPRRLEAPDLVEPRIERAGDVILVGGVQAGGLGYLGLHRAGGGPATELTVDNLAGDVIAVVPAIDASGAFVARADQSLELYGADGARVARVELGRERVRGLAAIGPSSVLVVLRRPDDSYVARRYQRRGGALAADADVALARGPRDGTAIAVAPDGKRLALLAPRVVPGKPPAPRGPASVPARVPSTSDTGVAVVVLDLATGSDVTPASLADRALEPSGARVAFSSARVLHVNDVSSGVSTIDLDAAPGTVTAVDTATGMLAAGDGARLGASGASLVVQRDGERLRVLGYRVSQPRAAALSPSGRRLVVSTWVQQVVIQDLDGAEPDRLLDLGGPRLTQVAFLDEQRLLVVEEAGRVVVRDVTTGAELQAVAATGVTGAVVHPRRTWVFAAQAAGGFWAIPIDLSSATPLGAPRLVDDHSMSLAAIDGPDDGPVLATLADGRVNSYDAAELAGRAAKAKKKRAPPATMALGNSDELGHFYVTHGSTIEITDSGGATSSFAVPHEPQLAWPLPGGGVLVGGEAAGGLVAYGLDGAQRWALGATSGLLSLSGSADHRRVAILTPSGLAVVDERSGAVLGLRCGWSFGAWDDAPLDGVNTVAPLCR